MATNFLRGLRGRFAGSEGHGKTGIPTTSRLSKFLEAKSEIELEIDYVKANVQYEAWINSLLSRTTSKAFPEFPYSYSRCDDGNHHIVLSDPTSKGVAIDSDGIWSNVLPKPGQVASLIWHRATGEILGIGVEKTYQRKGIATEIYNIAVALADSPAHLVSPLMSPTRTKAGDEWAYSLGVPIPEENHLATPEYWDMSDRP